jgi:TIR domain
LAKILAQRIPEILQGVRPFISEQIPPGKLWMEELRQALEQCRFGILCVTPEDKKSLWLQFEAGAIWKAEQQSQACALLYGLESAQLDGPLSYLQATEFDKTGMHKLLKSINDNANQMRLDDARFEKAFEAGWTEIERDVLNIPPPKEKPENPSRTMDDMVIEILNIVRSLPVAPPRMEPRSPSLIDLDNLPPGGTYTYVLPQEELDKLTAKLWVKPWPLPKMTNAESATAETKSTRLQQDKKKSSKH